MLFLLFLVWTSCESDRLEEVIDEDALSFQPSPGVQVIVFEGPEFELLTPGPVEILESETEFSASETAAPPEPRALLFAGMLPPRVAVRLEAGRICFGDWKRPRTSALSLAPR